jgi:hypothetical protein
VDTGRGELSRWRPLRRDWRRYEHAREAVRKALQLRDDCRAAKRGVADAERALKQAQWRDRQELAEALSRSRTANPEPKHSERAEAALEAARRRHDALVLAVEDSVDRFLETTDEADRVTEIARRQREESAAAIREASERVVQAVDHFEQILGAARWCADPQTR